MPFTRCAALPGRPACPGASVSAPAWRAGAGLPGGSTERGVRAALRGTAIVAFGGAMALGFSEAVFGGSLAAAELRRAPAVAALLGLLVLSRGPRALPAAAAWMLAGLAAGALLQDGYGLPGAAGSRIEALAEAFWLLVVAVLAWRGPGPWPLGPLLAAMVAGTRLGGYGRALAPILWEDTLQDAAMMGGGILAALAAGIIAFLVAGWCLAILARMPERWLAPGRVLAVLAVAAALGHMVVP